MTPPPPDPASLTRSLHSARADLETAEANIKLAILDAARAGDCPRVIDIVEGWATAAAGPRPEHRAVAPAMLDAKQVATLLGSSVRTVRRMVDGGRLPPPAHIGALVRWPREVIEAWIRDGCKPVRRGRTSP